MKAFFNKALQVMDRKEFLAGLVVVLLLALALSDLPGKFGVAVPRAELFGVVQVALVSFFASIVEGKFKPTSFYGAWQYLLSSTKFRLVLLTLFAVFVNTVLKAFKVSLPEEIIQSVINFATLAVLSVGGADIYRTLNK